MERDCLSVGALGLEGLGRRLVRNRWQPCGGSTRRGRALKIRALTRSFLAIGSICGLILGFAHTGFAQSAPPPSALSAPLGAPLSAPPASLLAPQLAAPPSARPVVPEGARAAAPRAPAESTPRPRPRDARDRAHMDGGMAITPGFSGGVVGSLTPPAPRAELAPRPNRDIELRPGQPSFSATITPTMIHPALPGRGAAAEGAASQTERRFLNTPAPGARLNVPMIW